MHTHSTHTYNTFTMRKCILIFNKIGKNCMQKTERMLFISTHSTENSVPLPALQLLCVFVGTNFWKHAFDTRSILLLQIHFIFDYCVVSDETHLPITRIKTQEYGVWKMNELCAKMMPEWIASRNLIFVDALHQNAPGDARQLLLQYQINH